MSLLPIRIGTLNCFGVRAMEFTTLSSLPVFHPKQYYIQEVSEGQGKVQAMAKLGRHLTERMKWDSAFASYY